MAPSPRKPTKSPSSAENAVPHSEIVQFGPETPLVLESGQSLSPWQMAYKTYGQLNADKSNAILICHALTGDQFVVGTHPVTQKSGWWETLIGPGKAINTHRYFIICANVVGGCMGSTGPASIDPATGQPYALNFPVITIHDMVSAQAHLCDHLGIETLLAVVGGSMGGMQVLSWASRFPHRVFSALPIATAARHSAQNIAFNEVGRQAVMADPQWHSGNYLAQDTLPARGLAVARMAAHITYLSEHSMHTKFGRNLQDRDKITFTFDADFQVESYLRHQGVSFVERFDANSYLYLTRAMDYFDLASEHGGILSTAFAGTNTRFCVVSFTSDWLFPPRDSMAVVHALIAANARVSYVEIETDKGHDAFLLHEPQMFAAVEGFLKSVARERGIHMLDDGEGI